MTPDRPDDEPTVLSTFGTTWARATFRPTAFFRTRPREGGSGAALLYYLVLGTLMAGVRLFWATVGRLDAWRLPDTIARAPGLGALGPVVDFLLVPLGLLTGLAVGTVVIHLLLRLFGDGRGGIDTTLRVLCYAYSPMAFAVVPYVGTVVGGVWVVVLAIIGLREAHDAQGWEPVLAVILPFVLVATATVLFLLAALAAGIGRLAA